MSLTQKSCPIHSKKIQRKQRDDFIEDWYVDVRAVVIADYLGIDKGDVYSRAYRMGLTRERESRPLITNQDMWHMKCLTDDLDVREIAFKFNLTEAECHYYLNKEVQPMLFN